MAGSLPEGDGVSGPNDLVRENEQLTSEELQEGLHQAYQVRAYQPALRHILTLPIFVLLCVSTLSTT